MFKTLLSVLVVLFRIAVTIGCLLVIGFLAFAFKYYANSGETATAFCCLFTSLCAIGIIYFVWNRK